MPGDYISFDQNIYVALVQFIGSEGDFKKKKSVLVNKALADFFHKNGVKLPPETREKYAIK